MGIGENIRRIRMAKNLTGRDLASLVGVTPGMISLVERGSRVPTMALGKAIADALGVSILALYGE